MIIGIAGKACSGKNAAASFFEKRGFRSIDVDKLGHEALEIQKDAVIEHFGRDILTASGEINRKLLGRIVFRDISKMKELETITHPVIYTLVESIIKSAHNEKIIINAAILGTSGMDVFCDKVLWIDSSLYSRVKRAINRDRNRIFYIFSRIRTQRELTVQHFFEGVDIYMVRNRGSLADLEKQIELFLENPEIFKRV